MMTCDDRLHNPGGDYNLYVHIIIGHPSLFGVHYL